MQLAVGRVGRAHGIAGDVTLDVRTSDPSDRLVVGAVLATDPPEAGPLTVTDSRWHSGRLLVRFAGVQSRAGAEALRGVLLVFDSEQLPALADPDDFYDHELVGLLARHSDGTDIGTVADVLHLPGGDVLSLTRLDGVEVLVPFVRSVVPDVDLSRGLLVVSPPPGLLDLPESRSGAPQPPTKP